MSLDLNIGSCDFNITHNLRYMAAEAGIVECLWSPEEHGFERAEQLIEPLEKALVDLQARPEHYEQFNAPNGWGTHEAFVRFVRNVLEACRADPEASVEAYR